MSNLDEQASKIAGEKSGYAAPPKFPAYQEQPTSADMLVEAKRRTEAIEEMAESSYRAAEALEKLVSRIEVQNNLLRSLYEAIRSRQ